MNVGAYKLFSRDEVQRNSYHSVEHIIKNQTEVTLNGIILNKLHEEGYIKKTNENLHDGGRIVRYEIKVFKKDEIINLLVGKYKIDSDIVRDICLDLFGE